MPKNANLASQIERQLPAELIDFMQTAAWTAASRGQSLYLVGGVVRDLLLERANFDLDLVVEGDAIELAKQLAELKQGKVVTHPQFKTAKLQWSNWSVDLTTARSEIYDKPGALPQVTPGSIENDLSRRDFTINAMAIKLGPSNYGELLDIHKGKDDLKHKLIRILHKKSFIDDATRIWRALRYEQRLDFQLGKTTLRLLKRDIPMLDTISGDRVRYELECVFQEECPEKVLRRAEELGVLQKLHPGLTGNDWLTDKFEAARKRTHPASPSFGLYLALLAYRLNSEESESLISRLRLSKSAAQTVRDTAAIRTEAKTLGHPEVSRNHIYFLLHRFSSTAIMANSLTSKSPIAQQHLETFFNELRYVKPFLTGNDLIQMGVPVGPQIKKILQHLHEARLDGEVTSKEDEEELVKGWLIHEI